MRDSTHEAHQPVQLPFFPTWNPDLMMQAFAPYMNAAPQLNGGLVNAWMEMGRQWSTFLMRRFQEDFELMQKLAACRDPGAVGGICASFFKTAQEDYQKEFSEMTRLGQTLLGTGSASFQATPETQKQAPLRNAA
jgi:Phasin protein